MKPRILLVDDEPNIIHSYSRGLRKNWDLVTALNGEEALKAIGEQEPFSVIVSDFNMPRMNGIVFLAKAMALAPESVRMMLTGEGDFQIATKAVNEGNIFRFITKPCSLDNLERALQDGVRQYELLRLEKETRRQELEIAGDIQKTLLVEEIPEGLADFDLAASTMPSKDVDGDFIDFFKFSHEKFDLIVGDVMGKGLHAAMVGAAAKSHLAKVLWRLNSANLPDMMQPQQIMQDFSDRFAPGLIQVQKFITMVYARFSATDSTLTFVDAGHTPVLWFSQPEQKWTELKGFNSPVGLPQAENFKQTSIKFSPGDIFIFYSDGLMDGRNRAGEYFGDNAMMICLKNCTNFAAAELLETLINTSRKFVASDLLVDDLTIIVVKIKQVLNFQK